MPSPTVGSVSFQSQGVGQTGDQWPRPPHLVHLLRFGPEFASTAPNSIETGASEVDEPAGAAGVDVLDAFTVLRLRMLASSSTDIASRTVGTLSSCLATSITALSVCCSDVDIFA